MHKKAKKLVLAKEDLRRLTVENLDRAVGGLSIHIWCDSVEETCVNLDVDPTQRMC
jgi:ferredoxin-fold anticodon binding domain-containing protein